MSTDYQEFVRLTREKRQTENALKSINEALRQLEARIIADMEANEVDNIRVDGMSIYPKRDLAVKVKCDEDDLCTAMPNLSKRAVNRQSLKAAVREMLTDESGRWEAIPERLPENIRNLLEIDEFVRVNARESD